MYSFQAIRPRLLAQFWGAVMDLDLLDVGDDPAMLDVDNQHGPTWLFQRADVAAPQPTPRVRIDITSDTDDGWRDLAERAEAAGARRHGEHDVDGVRWIEMTDTDDNPFRVFAPRPT
jgi:hypothetical protein